MPHHHWTVALRGHLAGPASVPEPRAATDLSPWSRLGLAWTILAPTLAALWAVAFLGLAS